MEFLCRLLCLVGIDQEIRLDTHAAVSCSVFHDLIVMLEFLFKIYFWCLYRVEEIPFDSSLLNIDNEWMLNSEFSQMHMLCLLRELCGFLLTRYYHIFFPPSLSPWRPNPEPYAYGEFYWVILEC